MGSDDGEPNDDLVARIVALVEQLEDSQRLVDALEAQVIVDRELIAHLVAEGVVQREKIKGLEIALVSARRIGAAVGILMALHKISADAAFEVLKTASQTTNRKLRDIADVVLATGATDWPTSP